MSRNSSAAAQFEHAYGDKYVVVSDYWLCVSSKVELVDLLPVMPALGGLPPDDLSLMGRFGSEGGMAGG